MIKETPVETEVTDTICSYCSVGCSLKLETCGDMLIKANPDKDGTVNKGLADVYKRQVQTADYRQVSCNALPGHRMSRKRL